MSSDQEMGSSERDRALEDSANTHDEPRLQQEVERLTQWVATRLYHRGIEARRERDRDDRGVATVLSWLASDIYTFEQKFETMSALFPEVGNFKGFVVVGDQLRRLRYRCRVILTEGHDPGGNSPFTCPVPSHAVDRDSAAMTQSFRAMVDGHATGTIDVSLLRSRFASVATAIHDVARWIKNREFDVI